MSSGGRAIVATPEKMLVKELAASVRKRNGKERSGLEAATGGIKRG
jgi:hypothetical protein